MFRRNHFVRWTCLLLLVVVAPVWGQAFDADSLEPDKLYMRHGIVDTAAVQVAAQAVAPASSNRLVIQLDGPMTRARRAVLDAAGVVVEQYIPVNAFIVNVENATPGALASLDFVRWTGQYRDNWKLDPQIGQVAFAQADRVQMAAEGKHQVVVSLFQGEDLNATVAALQAAGAEIVNASAADGWGAVEVRVADADLAALKSIPAVQFVEDAPEITLRNDQTAWVIQSNINGMTPVWDQGITGSDGLGGNPQIGALIDSGVRTTHCLFADPGGNPIGPTHRKILAQYGSTTVGSHGTHTAGTFVGDRFPIDGSTFRNGMAYGAKAIFRNTSTVSGSNLYTLLEGHHDDGARLHSNSWGNDLTTSYTQWCRDIDRYSWDYEDGLVCFAATNQSSLRTPENAKNCVAVEATNSPNSQEFKCIGGVGPTQDGRRKPDIFAPGCSIDSSNWTGGTCSFAPSGGTSMSCPAVAGAGLLVREYYETGFYPNGAHDPNDAFNPSGALVKATLINAAHDMTGVGGSYPNNVEGWGLLRLDESLHFAGDPETMIVYDKRRSAGDGLATSEDATYTFNVDSSTVPLRITLVWADFAAAVNANPTLVNNLDLEVTAPGGLKYKGNVFSANESTTGGSADTLNNVEQVHRFSPAAGAWEVKVIGTSVQMDTQGYAIVVTGDLSTAAPIEGDFDGDGDVDLTDFGQFSLCFAGANVPPAGTCPPGVDADFDNDGDVDLSDFATLSLNFTGPL